MDVEQTRAFVESTWDETILPTLERYIEIPNQSPHFDPDWASAGHMDAAVKLVAGWVEKQEVPGLELEVIQMGGRTPVLLLEVPGDVDDTVLLYGHLDKQPPMHGWDDDLGPWKPVIRDGKLYGRGGADDGYAAFAATTAIKALAQQQISHARCVVLIECCEESGSYDLPFYIEHLTERIGTPSLIVCLDSGCGDYERLWMTTSLRGMVAGLLEVDILTEGVHSGAASGVVPSSFRIARHLLSRLEDPETGKILPESLYVKIPDERIAQVKAAAEVLGDTIYSEFPFVDGARPVTDALDELFLNKTWRPQLSVTGAGGLPAIANAGNVLRPQTTLKLSMRLPPTADPKAAAAALRQLLEAKPAYNAKVSFKSDQTASGWNAPATAPWLEKAVQQASQTYFGHDAAYMGEGGSIPFMAMLGEKFPEAQFMITGVLGPKSNAHGPNEFLEINMGKRLTSCVANVLAAHARR